MKKTLLLLFVCLFVGISHAQAQVTVKGTVISSENNEPVIGASVLVKGTTNGTITDINGQFTLTNISPTNKTIIVSFIGMETQEVTIKPEMKIVMTSTTEVMEEVLVVAYGTAKKSAFTGSAKMIHTEQITKRPVTNVIESLSGQVAGLQMTMTNGQPGETPSILIRGISSMSAKTDPLIVLDGMPYEGGWNNINPADVESISVLKDAASTALYGARGANGVIIITTKSAKAGDAKITVDAKWSANTRGEIEYDYIKDPGEYYQAHYKALYNYYLNAQGQTPDQAYVSANTNMIGTNSQTGGLSYNVYSYPEGEYLIGKNGLLNPNAKLGRIVNGYYLTPDNWVDAVYHTALRQEYNVNISGGSDKAQIYASFGYLDEDGIAEGSDYSRITGRLKTTYQAKPWMRFGANISYTHSIQNSAAGGFSQAFNTAPIYPLYLRDTNGKIMQDKNGDMYDFGVSNQGPLNRPINPNSNDADVVNTIWYYNYKFLNNVNNALSALEKADDAPENKYYKGICLSYRAMIYMDLVRMYEYKKTGVEKLDAEAASKNLYGITVPIITAETTEEEGRNNPRAPFYAVYKFILDDLASAEELLSDYQRPTKNLPCTPVVHGLMARMWLEMGSRFELYPEDLNTLNNNTDLNIASKETCFTKAAEYARKVINESGAMPLTEKEWFGGDSYTTGFNSVLTNSWVWGSIMTTEDVHSYWLNFAGSMCPEQTFGYGNRKWQGYKLIGRKLFDQIPNADWRKTTWIAPEDAHKAPGTKYRTLLTDDDFADMPPYTGIKFRPKNGEMNDYTIGAAVDYPLMRIEEMYLIEAEAIGMSQGLAAGISKLEDFVNTFRYNTSVGSYTCKVNDLKEFQKKVVEQKRIEFWGEGIIFWDYKRLELQVVRGYPGTNAPIGYRFNSIEGYCAPWMNIFISLYENVFNKGAVLNPDPSQAIKEWVE
jgi:TonB-dependent SusC/RagA subfamily outer membrane receptor